MQFIEFHQLALSEYRKARRRYARGNIEVAQRFVREVTDALERIAIDPEAHPIEADHFRWARVRRFPYRLIFERDSLGVFIVAVAHNARRPGYWRRRSP